MKNKIMFSLFTILLIVFFNSDNYSQKQYVISKDGVKINFNTAGSGEPALVFVHGWGCDKSYWDKQVKEFSAKYKVVTIDLAGHGKSGMNRKKYTIGLFGEDIAAVVNKLMLNKIILIGHSLGGSVILEAANILKGKVIGLIGADSFQKFQAGEPADRAEKFLSTFKSNFIASAKDYASLLFMSNADTTLVHKVENKMSSANPKIAIDILRNSYQYNSIAAVKRLNIPIISINGEKFPVYLDENVQLVKSFKVKKMNGVGHFIMLEDPIKFNQLLQEAITELTK